jgi:hypothetical protein
MENKIKHLEFIQQVITRMNANSFIIKGWTITLIAALFALAAKDANENYIIVSYIPIPIFWILDGFYVFQERQYTELYKNIAAKDPNDIDFSMDASRNSNYWLEGIFSKTLIAFYGASIIVTIIVMKIIINN